MQPWAGLIKQLGSVEQEIVRRQVESLAANPLSPGASPGPENPRGNPVTAEAGDDLFGRVVQFEDLESLLASMTDAFVSLMNRLDDNELTSDRQPEIVREYLSRSVQPGIQLANTSPLEAGNRRVMLDLATADGALRGLRFLGSRFHNIDLQVVQLMGPNKLEPTAAISFETPDGRADPRGLSGALVDEIRQLNLELKAAIPQILSHA